MWFYHQNSFFVQTNGCANEGQAAQRKILERRENSPSPRFLQSRVDNGPRRRPGCTWNRPWSRGRVLGSTARMLQSANPGSGSPKSRSPCLQTQALPETRMVVREHRAPLGGEREKIRRRTVWDRIDSPTNFLFSFCSSEIFYFFKRFPTNCLVSQKVRQPIKNIRRQIKNVRRRPVLIRRQTFFDADELFECVRTRR